MKKQTSIRNRVVSRLILMVMCMAFLSMPITAMAGSVSSDTIQKFISENAPVYDNNDNVVREGTSEWVSGVSGYFSRYPDANFTKAVTAIDESTGTVTTYYYNESQSSNIGNAMGSISEADKVQTQLDDMTNQLGIHADVNSAIKSLSGVTGVVNLIVGIIVVGIDLGMILYTAFDVCYLLFPILRQKMESNLQEGKGVNVTQKDGVNSYRFVSDEAVNAYNQSVMGESKRQPYLKYFVKRIWAYVAVVFLTYVLLSGNISIITTAAMKLVSGVLDLFGGIF